MPGKVFNKATHCIFDLDGLLLDTEDLYLKATLMIMGEFQKVYTVDIHQHCMNMRPSQACKFLIKHFALPLNLSQYYSLHDEYSLMLMQHTQLMPGAERLIQHLAKYKIPIAVVTSAPYSLFALKTRPHQQLFKHVSHVVFADADPKLVQSTPQTNVFHIAASRFLTKPKRSECLVFEDSSSGMTAALKAGMQVVMVPNLRVPYKIGARATQCLSSLQDFKPNDFGLPNFES